MWQIGLARLIVLSRQHRGGIPRGIGADETVLDDVADSAVDKNTDELLFLRWNRTGWVVLHRQSSDRRTAARNDKATAEKQFTAQYDISVGRRPIGLRCGVDHHRFQ